VRKRRLPSFSLESLLMAPLELMIGLALFPKTRSAGASAIVWGLGLALFLWAGLRSVGLSNARAIPFAVVSGVLITLFVYVRGEASTAPPAARPWEFIRRARARRAAQR
jgi:hypothetical protein